MTTLTAVIQPDPHLVTPSGKPRARSLGLSFAGDPGPLNAITDVPGVEVGYVTLVEGDSVRTGVTAIHPRGKAGSDDPMAAGFHSQNGNGEMTGVSWIEESGTCAGPVAITSTHAVGVAHAGVIAWLNQRHGIATWHLPVAAETWDGYLNDINGHHVNEEHVVAALDDARGGPVEEGSVGGGTGMNCYGFKGGSGTASRVVEHKGTDASYTVGVFLQANFGARRELTITGVPLGSELADDNPMSDFFAVPPGAGSVIVVVATDAPLLPGQCEALARRVTLGLARTGTAGSHSSGDLFLALSVANPGAFAPGKTGLRQLSFLPWGAMDPFFTAVVQATEEAVINALVANEEMTGRDEHRSPALPRDRVAQIVRRRTSG